MPQHYYDSTEGAAALLLLGSTPSTLGSESLVGSMDQHAASAVAKPHSQHSLRSSNGSSGNILLSEDDDDDDRPEGDAATLGASTLAQHSDYTVQMSNRHRKQFPPPMNDVLLLHHQQRLVSSDNGNGIRNHNNNNNNNAPSTTQPSQGRRAIFGAGIQRKYGAPNRAAPVMDSNQPQIMWPHDNDDNLSNRSIPFYQTGAGGVLAPSSSSIMMSSPLMQKLHGGGGGNNNNNYGSIEMENDNGNQQQQLTTTTIRILTITTAVTMTTTTTVPSPQRYNTHNNNIPRRLRSWSWNILCRASPRLPYLQ